MDLDDLTRFRSLDPDRMLDRIDGLPEQIETAWNLGRKLPLPPSLATARQVIVAGVGGSAIGGSLLEAYTASRSRVPLSVWRNYGLPAWAAGEDTLVLAISYSGETEETLSAFRAALDRRIPVLAITSGGTLAHLAAKQNGASLWQFDFQAQPRAALGYLFALPLCLFSRLGWIPDPQEEIAQALTALRTQQASLRAEVPAVRNPAKRMAGQWIGRFVAIFASDLLAPVARRWRTQVAEVAKAWGQFEELPELDHNAIAGSRFPEELIDRFRLVFLRSSFDHPRNRLRSEFTRELLMEEGFNTDEFSAAGDSPLSQMLTAVHFGDYTSYYLAMGYAVNPTPVQVIQDLKARLAANP
ncbi:MAG: bifunctional phosphoglucose/phosphomannose isomerase [Anaerolineales bacterium]